MFVFEKISHIARPIDLTYPTNTLITLLIFLASLFGFLQSGNPGMWQGLGVFMVWALAREVSPYHEYWAFVSVGLWIVLSLLFSLPAFYTVAVGVMFSMRLLNRSSGAQPTFFDVVILGYFQWWLVVNWSPMWLLLSAVTLVLYYYLELFPQKKTLSTVGDVDGKKLRVDRVRAGQLFFVFSCCSVFVVEPTRSKNSDFDAVFGRVFGSRG